MTGGFVILRPNLGIHHGGFVILGLDLGIYKGDVDSCLRRNDRGFVILGLDPGIHGLDAFICGFLPPQE